MAVITISRQIGAGGWTLGNRVAKRLDYRYVDEVIIKEVAEKIGVTRESVRAFEKEGATRLMRFLDKVVSWDFIERLISDKYGYVDEKRYVDVVKAIMKELYAKGNMVIVGRAGQYILKDLDNHWRVLLVDEFEHRIYFVMDTYNLTREQAEKFIRSRDQMRANFLTFFAPRESHDDPRSYDLAINMERVGMEKAEELIVGLIGQES
ncbi:MAG: cytidylate kinase-like family protein [Deltaproteobacteria bacterium]|nr:cytidylate kinase-like family protein [Deltaproteobacteria bacterium]